MRQFAEFALLPALFPMLSRETPLRNAHHKPTEMIAILFTFVSFFQGPNTTRIASQRCGEGMLLATSTAHLRCLETNAEAGRWRWRTRKT